MDTFLVDLSQKIEKGVDLQSDDMQQHSISEPSHSASIHITTNSSSIHIGNPFESQILQTVKMISSDEPKSLLSEVNGDAKAKEIRKKCRPPKSEKQSIDGFCCSVCRKVFSNSSSLVKHNVTHSEERRFVCSECPKTFKRNDHLMGHMSTHSDVKPFKCDGCDKSYCDSRSLKRHVDQCHSFKCNEVQMMDSDTLFCNKSNEDVPRISDLNMKLKNNFYEELVSESPKASSSASQLHLCRMCGRTFKTMQALNGHMRHHVVNVPKKDVQTPMNFMDNQDGRTISPNNSTLLNTEIASKSCSQNSLTELIQFNKNLLASGRPSVSEGTASVQHGRDAIIDQATFSTILMSSDSNSTTKSLPHLLPSFLTSSMESSQPLITSSSLNSRLPSENLSRIDCSILLLENSPQSFVLKPQLQQQSYSLQLQHLAQQVQPGSIVQGYGQELTKGSQLQQADAHVTVIPGRLSSNKNIFTSASDGAPRPSPPHSLLHTLLMQKNDKKSKTSHPQKFCQEDDLHHLPSTFYRIDASADNILMETAEGGLQQELLENYSVDVNFDGFGLEGIEKLLDHGSKIERTTDEDIGMESSIPEDLRNIPTHALQMFSLTSTSGSGTPPPLLDHLGNEVISDVRSNDLRNHAFAVVSEYNDNKVIANEDVIEANVEQESAHGDQVVQCTLDSSWTGASVLGRDELMKSFLVIPKDDSEANEELLKSKSLEESLPVPDEDKASENNILGSTASSCQINALPTPPKIEKFRNPGLLKMKRRHWPGPLIIPPTVSLSNQVPCTSHKENSSSGSSSFAFQSRLRSPRVIPGSGSFDSSVPPPFNLPFVPYTPPPMLSPMRNSSGLFCLIQAVIATQTPPTNKSRKIGSSISPELFEGFVEEVVAEESILGEPPATDVKPHINEGPEFQANIPDLDPNPASVFGIDNHAEMVWNPSVTQNVPESEMRYFMEFSSSAAVPSNGCNKELAHHILYLYNGDIKRACLAIMQIHPLLPPNHFVDTYKYSETSIWSSTEIERFTNSIIHNSKDFYLISKEVGSKSCKECVEFYYLWKKICGHESGKLKSIRRKNDIIYNNLRSKISPFDISSNGEEECLQLSENVSTFTEKPQALLTTEIQSFPFPHIPSPESSYQQTLPTKTTTGATKRQGRHPRTSGKSTRHRTKLPQASPTLLNPDSNAIFPCKICKKVFYKVKSRSAHMKTHRMQANVKKPPPSPPFIYNYHSYPSSINSSVHKSNDLSAPNKTLPGRSSGTT